jgi:TRAP-type C4-dicarboxylate transport system substrate-binding protein
MVYPRTRGKHRSACFWLLATILAGFVGQPAVAQVVSLRIGCTNPAGSVVTDPIDRFVPLLAQKSKGQVTARNFYQALGIEQKLAQSIMSGTVDIGTMTTSSAATFTSAFYVYDLPFLFRTYDDMLVSLEGPIGRRQIAQFEKDTGLKVLAIFGFGAGRDIQTRRTPLRTPADIVGLKIRTTAAPIEVATYRAWGANPTPVDFSQTLTALQQGTVDGLNLDTPAVLSTKMYEAVKFNTRLSYQMNMLLFYMNAQKFASLTPDQQQAIIDSAREVELWNRKDAAERLASYEKELAKLGVTTYTPTADEWNQWAAIRDTVWKQAAEAQKGKLDLGLARQLAGTKP